MHIFKIKRKLYYLDMDWTLEGMYFSFFIFGIYYKRGRLDSRVCFVRSSAPRLSVAQSNSVEEEEPKMVVTSYPDNVELIMSFFHCDFCFWRVFV